MWSDCSFPTLGTSQNRWFAPCILGVPKWEKPLFFLMTLRAFDFWRTLGLGSCGHSFLGWGDKKHGKHQQLPQQLYQQKGADLWPPCAVFLSFDHATVRTASIGARITLAADWSWTDLYPSPPYSSWCLWPSSRVILLVFVRALEVALTLAPGIHVSQTSIAWYANSYLICMRTFAHASLVPYLLCDRQTCIQMW